MTDKLLILDLDETLFNTETYMRKGAIPIYGYWSTILRPYHKEFLDYVFNNFTVAVWTAASEGYAKMMLQDHLNVDLSKLKFFYDQKNCTPKYIYTGGRASELVMYKNISKLRKRGYNMEKILMIDDKPKYIDSYGNVIGIKPYDGRDNDNELLKLINYLDSIKDVDNVRTIEKRGWSATS